MIKNKKIIITGGLGFIVYGDGEQSRDFTFVRHVMDANILAISPLKPVI
jgi:dTDP-D-glucose 4,6-dehydratase